MLSIDEAIEQFKYDAECNRADLDLSYAENNEQVAEWLEELKALREYKERMEMQYLDDIDNPLEPLKLQSAIQSEIFKLNYRKEHKPQDVNILDYTVIAALKYCLAEQLKEGRNTVN